MHPLDNDKIDFETDGYGSAVRRFWEKRDQTRLSDSNAGRFLLRSALPRLADEILRKQEEIRAGTRPRHWKEFVALEPEKLALLTLLTLMDGFRGEREGNELTKYTMLAKRLGEWCATEYAVDQMPHADRVRRWIAASGDKNPRRAAKRFKPFDKLDWSEKRLDLHLGGAPLGLALDHTGLFRLEKGGKKASRICLTGKAIRKLEDCFHEEQSMLRPKFLPMIVPPRPRKGVEGGGYLRFEMSLVKRDDDEEVQEALKESDLRVPCEAVNAIQTTPFRINERIRDLLAKAWEAKGPSKALPYIDLPELPPFLSKESTSPDEWERRKRERERARQLRAMGAANRIASAARLSICEKFRGREEIYFPHQIDLRGRAYPVPQVIQPQADDLSRALLEFAHGKPLGDRGGFWLAIQLANLFGHGIDKLPLEKRFCWVEENRERIIDSAQRPLDGGLFWTEAEKKWRFLAAVLEWAGYAAEGPGFVSHQPIAMDGTCNGLQHLSALGRDLDGGRWTNLVPGPEPQDLYPEVANRLQEIVDAEAARGDPMAVAWKPRIKRGLVKQATMTTPYGVTVSGMKGQLRSVILEEYRDCFVETKGPAEYLAPRVNRAIGRVVVKAAEIRGWLRKLVKKLARPDRGLKWTVPTGFPVCHEYHEEK